MYVERVKVNYKWIVSRSLVGGEGQGQEKQGRVKVKGRGHKTGMVGLAPKWVRLDP